jgi:hypothetical protein
MSTVHTQGEGSTSRTEKAAWGIALGILAYWGLRILGRDRPLKVEPDKDRGRRLSDV